MYWQNFLLTAGVVVLTLVLLGMSFFILSYSYTRRERAADMRARADVVSRMVSSYVTGGSLSGMRQLASFAASVTDEDFLICNLQGNVLLTSDETLEGRVLTLPEGMTDAILRGEVSFDRTTLGDIYTGRHFAVGVPIISMGQTVGVVLAVTEARSLTAMWREFIVIFFMTTVTVLLISFLVSAWLSMRQSRPIREMAGATRLFAEGNFDVRMRGYDDPVEIAELAGSFNNMADSLQETERQRREFIANVSHELKTPMTTIAGYTDGILDGTIPRSRQNEYLSIISSETKRLSRLVRSMLDMSQLQAREPGAVLGKTFDLCEVMRLALLSLEHKITDKGLDVDAQLPEEAVMVRGEQDAINQVVYNLIDNAAKFAPRGSVLRLAVWKQTGKAYVSVENDGETISPEELPLIFDRFHKTDKSRSQDRDGVGLGLYIVKTILDNHGEDIFVTSRDGVTRFVFTMTVAEK
ncbi:MAG: HAMP domain-containing histidine kinase [Oscillospiraceae bacterium]|nr:HAMP domain-containing histidine kinase [Oscillospiraceae bacterium]